MCDTAVLVTEAGVFFAKNSDRDPNEAQLLDWQPGREHPVGARLRCTAWSVPQARRTHAVLLSRPYWSWGAEIAANQHGVIVGNEAVFTRTRVPRQGLSGMDLVRLAVERGESAAEAVAVLRALVKEHPQGGRCGHEDPAFRYFSSFIVADRRTAFVVETCGHESTQHEVQKGSGYSISNGLSLPDFAARHSDPFFSWASGCRSRRAHTQRHIQRILAGPIDRTADADGDSGQRDASRIVGKAQPQQPGTSDSEPRALDTDATILRALMAMLREHGDDDASGGSVHYSPLFGGLSAPCVHGGGLLAASQTTASWVAKVGGSGGDRHLVTATAAPCTGLFKPVWVDRPLSPAVLGPPPRDVVDPTAAPSLFWQHERLHRAVLQDPATLLPLFAPARDALEARFLHRPPAPEEAFALGWQALSDWTNRVERHLSQNSGTDAHPPSRRPTLVERYWQKRSEQAGLIPGIRKSHRAAFRDPD